MLSLISSKQIQPSLTLTDPLPLSSNDNQSIERERLIPPYSIKIIGVVGSVQLSK